MPPRAPFPALPPGRSPYLSPSPASPPGRPRPREPSRPAPRMACGMPVPPCRKRWHPALPRRLSERSASSATQPGAIGSKVLAVRDTAPVCHRLAGIRESWRGRGSLLAHAERHPPALLRAPGAEAGADRRLRGRRGCAVAAARRVVRRTRVHCQRRRYRQRKALVGGCHLRAGTPARRRRLSGPGLRPADGRSANRRLGAGSRSGSRRPVSAGGGRRSTRAPGAGPRRFPDGSCRWPVRGASSWRPRHRPSPRG